MVALMEWSSRPAGGLSLTSIATFLCSTQSEIDIGIQVIEQNKLINKERKADNNIERAKKPMQQIA